MQRTEMKKILGKFEMHFLQMSVYFFMEFVRSLRLVLSFFAMDREAAPKVKKKEEIILFKFLRLRKNKNQSDPSLIF